MTVALGALPATSKGGNGCPGADPERGFAAPSHSGSSTAIMTISCR